MVPDVLCNLGPFGLIQWCVLEQDFFWGGGEAVVYAKLIFIFGIEKLVYPHLLDAQ